MTISSKDRVAATLYMWSVVDMMLSFEQPVRDFRQFRHVSTKEIALWDQCTATDMALFYMLDWEIRRAAVDDTKFVALGEFELRPNERVQALYFHALGLMSMFAIADNLLSMSGRKAIAEAAPKLVSAMNEGAALFEEVSSALSLKKDSIGDAKLMALIKTGIQDPILKRATGFSEVMVNYYRGDEFKENEGMLYPFAQTLLEVSLLQTDAQRSASGDKAAELGMFGSCDSASRMVLAWRDAIAWVSGFDAPAMNDNLFSVVFGGRADPGLRERIALVEITRLYLFKAKSSIEEARGMFFRSKAVQYLRPGADIGSPALRELPARVVAGQSPSQLYAQVAKVYNESVVNGSMASQVVRNAFDEVFDAILGRQGSVEVLAVKTQNAFEAVARYFEWENQLMLAGISDTEANTTADALAKAMMSQFMDKKFKRGEGV